MNLLRLSLNLLRRDWRAGEWRVLMLALVLAVGSLATVGLFADRVRQALQQQATSLIGADLRITSTRPLSPEYRSLAEAHGLRAVESRTFPSMVSCSGNASEGERVLLAEIQAVEQGYPLRGKVEVDDGGVGRSRYLPSPQSSDETTSQSTKPSSWQVSGYPLKGRGGERENQLLIPGTVWADERLMSRLGVRVGDELVLGGQRFKLAARIVRDVDQSVGFASFAPRVMMDAQDLAATGLVREGSRVSYRLMVAGEVPQVAAFRAALHLTPNEKMEDVRDARPEIREALERAEHFLGLAALTAAILAGAAMALASRRYVARHLDGCAVMRCLGAAQGQVLRLFLYQFVLFGLLAVTAGCVLGYVTQAVMVEAMAGMRAADLPQPGVLPALKAAASGLALLMGFAFLPLLQLGRVSPLRVLRRELGAPPVSVWLGYGSAALVLAGLFVWQAGSLKLGLYVLFGLLAGLAVFGGLAWGLLQGLHRGFAVTGRMGGGRYALTHLARRGPGAALQIVALSLGGMALLLLTLVRADLLAGWQGKLPADTPNRFLVGVQPEQRQAVLDHFRRQQLPQPMLLPMVKGRLVAINGRAISGDSYPEPRARGLVEREFNLSWAGEMPSWNTLAAGRWWASSGERGEAEGQLSVEEGIAKTLGIRLGDRLTYDVAGSRFTAQVTSLRRVQWDSMRVNFFVIATPQLLQDYPASYLASFFLPQGRVQAGEELVRDFPGVLLIDTGAVIAQVRDIIGQISQAVSVIFLFTLAGGGVVLYAAMLSMQDERAREAAILRTLGAESRLLRRLHLGEFALLGLLSGLFAAAGAVLLGSLLASRVLDIPYRPGMLIWLVSLSCGAALLLAGGWLEARRLAAMPPTAILRDL